MSAAAALAAGRALAESLMEDACRVARGGQTVYIGRCRVQAATAPPVLVSGVQGFAWNIDDALIQLPVSAPDLLDGDTVTITSSPNTTHLVGTAFRVRATMPTKTHETKRSVVVSKTLATFLGDSITILRAAVVTDPYGNRVLDWTNPTTTTVPANVQPVGSNETDEPGSRDQVSSRYQVWVGPDVDVLARDRIQWSGVTLSIDGEPQVSKDSAGVPHHKAFIAVISRG